MAKKISQLTQATEVKSDDVTVIVQDGETKKLPLNMMVTKQDIENKKVAGLAKLDEIEATYENDTYTPTITVKNKSSVKVGEGDGVDYSANVMDGPAKSAILKGSTKYRDIDTGEFLETFEEGRNLELVSVEMPVLKTTGKNLFDEKLENNRDIDGNTGVVLNGGRTIPINFISVEPNTSYTLTRPVAMKNVGIRYYSKSQDYLSLQTFSGYTGKFSATFTTPSDCYFIKFIDEANTLEKGYQIEYGTQATSYEPYKSNILTVNEDVTLRGIGEVQDTLDCLTGEVTQRIGEIVLDGSESWRLSTQSDNYVDFRIVIDNSLHSYTGAVGLCDKFKYQSNKNGSWIVTDEGITVFNNQIIFSILKSRLTSTDANGFKTWLSQNPTTINYQLTTESVKTVDLMPSGTHPSTTPYCWKNGHIQLSSSGLLPNLEYSVVTSRAGQINQNATMIVKNDKRIFDLEILLAGGLVNTTYQALTLQNQVETGLSKVSLNSETEPDYLLYHMIMKLIEEKAYKLDDLTEKVSVFYLYEKLSDEQFETIYSALYPFVEDEIVEEPVVEELPEVVEDEVIM